MILCFKEQDCVCIDWGWGGVAGGGGGGGCWVVVFSLLLCFFN